MIAGTKKSSLPTLNMYLAVPVVTKWTTFLIVVKSRLPQSIYEIKNKKIKYIIEDNMF